MGISFSLPAGSWRVEEVRPGEVVAFRHRDSGREMTFMRRSFPNGLNAEIVLRSLFIHFDEKRRIARWRRPLRADAVAECADYLVKMNGQEVFIRACVVRKGTWAYEFAAWDIEKRRAATASLADAILDSVAFSAEGAAP